ncbi:MAG: Fic family protein [Coriobacteriia bacterium]|nr:Fic family protein [Coriobacteriia bacterium]
MKSFAYCSMPASAYSEECRRLQSRIHEHKGRLDALREAHADPLARLESRALLDNVDASARIDGICLDPRRIQELIDGSEPLTAREQQAAGYARTLRAFAAEPDRFAIDASTFLAMHTVLTGGAPTGKKSAYRKKDHVDMIMDGQVRRVPASPVPAFETPLYLGSACDNLAQAFAEHHSDRLLLIPAFAVDVMCIKPFDEGTGRLARLFSLLLMAKSGFDVFRYASIDRLCEQSAADYYAALNACLATWDGPACDYSPFALLWLRMVDRAYAGLFQLMSDGNAAKTGAPSPKSQQVRELFAFRSSPMTKAQVVAALPDVSLSTVENALRALVAEGYLVKLGQGRSTAYVRAQD